MKIGNYCLKCTQHAHSRFHERIKPDSQLSKNQVLEVATKSIPGFSFVWQLQANKNLLLVTVLPFESSLKNKRDTRGHRIITKNNQFYS